MLDGLFLGFVSVGCGGGEEIHFFTAIEPHKAHSHKAIAKTGLTH